MRPAEVSMHSSAASVSTVRGQSVAKLGTKLDFKVMREMPLEQILNELRQSQKEEKARGALRVGKAEEKRSTSKGDSRTKCP